MATWYFWDQNSLLKLKVDGLVGAGASQQQEPKGADESANQNSPDIAVFTNVSVCNKMHPQDTVYGKVCRKCSPIQCLERGVLNCGVLGEVFNAKENKCKLCK